MCQFRKNNLNVPKLCGQHSLSEVIQIIPTACCIINSFSGGHNEYYSLLPNRNVLFQTHPFCMTTYDLCGSLQRKITSSDCTFDCPIISTDIFSQCYFEPFTAPTIQIQATSLDIWTPYLAKISSNVYHKMAMETHLQKS